MTDKKIRLFSFGNSKGDYSWKGWTPGGLLSIIKNQQSGELYLLSCSIVFTEPFKPQDYCACSVFPCKEDRGIIFRNISVSWNYQVVACYRNTLQEAYTVHEQLKSVVSTVPRNEWGSKMPDPIPPDGLSPDASALMMAKGLSESSIRARFEFYR
jgi:hypothetical protein